MATADTQRLAPLQREAVAPREAGAPEAVSAEEAAPFWRRHPFLWALSALLLLLLAGAAYLYWDHSRRFEETDDAFVDARQFAVAPKVSGYVTEVRVTDNQHVAKGDVIAVIDPRDYRIAFERAQAQEAAARSTLQNLGAQVASQRAQVGESRAEVAQAEAALRFAQQEAARSRELAQRGSGTVQREQQATSTLQQQQSSRNRAQQGVAAAKAQVGSIAAQRQTAEANLREAEAETRQAELNLDYTQVVAAQSGRVVRLTAAVGQYAQAGAALAMFVPDDIWVTANYKETQLANMRVGQKARIDIDAYPGRPLEGRVASIQPGSGAAFSLLPPENATGNYVKIVQRVPVKIIFDHPPTDVALGPGMSVVPVVRVDPRPSLYERLRAAL
ncbi:HlyD family secretion protein [Methylocystis sp. JAN1]|uniref:HlyD family secretion protein n=1 Tax=Methylocystis sp. JAN1 TaxID=3397211 RepID=UPI003FA218B5